MPVPERASLSGPCAIIYSGDEEMDVRRVGGLVAEAVGVPLSDVTRKMRTSKGFVATGLEARLAVALAERVEKALGAPVLVIPVEACVEFPPLMRMRHVVLDAEGLRCEAYTWNQSAQVRAGWHEVFLVSCGRLELQEVVQEADGRIVSNNLVTPAVPRLVTRTHYEFLLDIVLSEPWRRLRLDQNTAAFSLTEMQQDPARVLGPLYRSSVNLERFARDVPMNRGVSLLASGGADLAWEPLTFLNKRDFDSYTYWLMQLVRYGRPIRP